MTYVPLTALADAIKYPHVVSLPQYTGWAFLEWFNSN